MQTVTTAQVISEELFANTLPALQLSALHLDRLFDPVSLPSGFNIPNRQLSYNMF